MEEQRVHIYSGIRSEFKRQVLLRGAGWAVLGGGMLLLGGMYIPTVIMSYIGLPFLLLGLGLISYGLVPYRRLVQIEAQPHQIIIGDDRTLHYFAGGQEMLSVPLWVIERVSYCDEAIGHYGIVVDLKENGWEQVTVHRRTLSLKRYIAETHRRYGCDLFFPYFSTRSYKEVLATLQP